MTTGTGGSSSGPRRIVLWFRNDLRLRDNAVLHTAVQKIRAKEADEVLPVYTYDPRFFAVSKYGMPKMGAHRAAFVQAGVEELKQALQRLNSNLLVASGKAEDVIKGALAGAGPGSLVLTQQEVTSEELRVDAAVARVIKPNAKLVQLWGPSLFHLEDLPFNANLGDMPDVFTPFKDKCEKRSTVRKELPAPAAGELPLPSAASLAPAVQQQLAQSPTWDQLPWPQGAAPAQPQPHPQAVLDFKGGEAAALARLKYYLWDSDLIFEYFNIRNGMLGGDYSTKLAPWLAAGNISPRTIYHEIRKYEAQRGSNKSTYWVIFELIWRDYFRFYALKHGNAIFFEGGPAGGMLNWSSDPELFQRWCQGTTGMPLVDANMRELAATGFMSNRGRQNVASYLALDLGVDWRRGADWFEHHLLDYDVASNWGNWVAAAGLTGGRINHFNITKQSKDYDPEGDYIRAWIPELKNVPASRIHEPWLMSKEEQQRYGVQIGQDYPNPIPAHRMARPHAGGGGGGGRSGYGGGSRGGRGYGGSSSRGGRGGSSRSGSDRQYKKSAYERFG